MLCRMLAGTCSLAKLLQPSCYCLFVPSLIIAFSLVPCLEKVTEKTCIHDDTKLIHQLLSLSDHFLF